LKTGDDVVWPDIGQHIAIGTEAALDPSQTRAVGGLVDDYQALLNALEDRFTACGYAYDPRGSLAEAAEAFGADIRPKLASGSGPVHFVTHGAGALLTLAALRTSDGLFEAWQAAGGRAVLLSPPLEGTWLATAHMAGATELCALLALLDRNGTPQDVGVGLARWPSLHELDPEDAAASTWRADLAPPTWARFSAIYGHAERTIRRSDRAPFVATASGDGYVHYPQGDGPNCYYRPIQNSDLPSDPIIAAAVLDLLGGRAPDRLGTSTPATRASEPALLRDLRGELLLPTARDLVRAAWGGETAIAGRSALRVSVVHGDLTSVVGPILVGHQDDTPIAGAEKAIDARLGGVLTRRIGLGAYPGALGTSELFGVADGAQASAAVIGLGNAGDLTPAILAAAVTRGVLRLAAAHLDRPESDRPERMTLSAVLIGTNLIPAMPVENSLNGLVTGVRHANRRLRDIGEPLRIDELQIVELYEERAIQAVHAARRLPLDHASESDDEIIVQERVVDGRDGRPGSPRPDYQDGVWRTVRIVNADPRNNPSPDERLVELSFTSIGRSARAEQRVNTGQRELIDALVAEAIDNPNTDDQLFNTLYEMIVPNSLKGQGYGGENLMVVVDEQSAILPLEMLATRTQSEDVRPLAVDVGVIRRLETRTFEVLTRQSAGKAALVIADPPGTGLPRLDAARDEARRVARVLTEKGYDVTTIIPGDEDEAPDVVRILNSLFRRSYRIVHMAGHGNYSATQPSRSGMAIGPDTYLTALEIAKMQTAPDLVFLNCCHLGAMRPRSRDGDPDSTAGTLRADRLASSISRQLIDNGVQAVVAAGWAVDDRAAAEFADLLYDKLLDGEDLGTASHSARSTIHRRYPTLNTWGAYQIYGPPAMKLSANRPGGHSDRPPVGRREFRDVLVSLDRRAARADEDTVAVVRRELHTLLRSVAHEWHSGGRELAILGRLWASLAVYDRAVQALDRLQRDWNAEATLKDLEELANVKAKWAVQQALEQSGDAADPPWTSLLDDADRIMELLIKIGPTPERLSLRAGVARRRARCATQPEEITAALDAARRDYAESARIHTEQAGDIDMYPTLNHIMLEWIVSRRRGERYDARRDQALIAAYQNTAPSLGTDFWSRVTIPDIALTTALMREHLPRDIDDIEQAYGAAFAHSSSRERATVIEHIEMIEAALPGPASTVKALATLRQRLKNWRPLT
jgi:CHAT domain-containing protein